MAQRTNRYPPKTLVKLQEVKIFAATYVDGKSYADTRFVAKIGDNYHFLHPEGVDSKLKRLAGWLLNAIKEKLNTTDSKPLDLPQDEVDLDGVMD
ncbi:MAG: hypothetical protein ACFFFC_00585 [Candidatus Thorarchaeota archaeon]